MNMSDRRKGGKGDHMVENYKPHYTSARMYLVTIIPVLKTGEN